MRQKNTINDIVEFYTDPFKQISLPLIDKPFFGGKFVATITFDQNLKVSDIKTYKHFWIPRLAPSYFEEKEIVYWCFAQTYKKKDSKIKVLLKCFY